MGGTEKQHQHTYTAMCKTASSWEATVSHTESGLVLCDGPGGQDGDEVWEGGFRGRGHTYTHGWFTLSSYGRNQHNAVKWLSSN